MIRAKGRHVDGRTSLVLGLTDGNLSRLVSGQPIHITSQEMIDMGMPPIHVFVLHGDTEASLAREMGFPIDQPGPGETITVVSPDGP